MTISLPYRRDRRYLTGVDWIIGVLDSMTKRATGSGNSSRILLELDGRADESRVREICHGFAARFPVLSGRPARDWLNLAPFWKSDGREGCCSVGMLPAQPDVESALAALCGALDDPFPTERDHLAFRLVHAGAFDGQKGQDLVVDVLSRLVSRGTDTTVLFLGDGPERPAVERKAAAAGLLARCEFRGEVAGTAVSPGLVASHLLLLPSRSEGAALVLAEAMAAGCVPVAHDVGGCAEVLGGGTGGRLVASLDLAAWVGAVSSLLADGAERARLAAGGRRLAAERTIARAASRVREELAGLVRAAGGTP